MWEEIEAQAMDEYGWYDYLDEFAAPSEPGGGFSWYDYLDEFGAPSGGTIDDAFYDLFGMTPGGGDGYADTDLGIADTYDPLAGVEPRNDALTDLLGPTDFWGSSGRPMDEIFSLDEFNPQNTMIDALLQPLSFTDKQRQAAAKQTAYQGQSWLGKALDAAGNFAKGLTMSGGMPGGGALPQRSSGGMLSSMGGTSMLALIAGGGLIYLAAKGK